MTKNKKPPMTSRQRLAAVWRVAKISFMTAPSAVIVQISGAIINAVLPIVTTFFAALTTTALAEAFSGDETAGARAMWYVVVTALLGILATAWTSVEQYVNQLMRYKVDVAISDSMYEHFLRLDYWRYDDKRTKDIFDRASQFARFFPYVFDRLSGILGSFIAMLAGLAALILVNWWLGLILIAAVIPGLIIQLRLSRAQADHWNANVETRRAKGMIEWDLLRPGNIAELRVNGLVRYLLDLRHKLRDIDEKAQIEFERKYIFKRLGAKVTEAVAEVVALIWIVGQIIGRAQPIGQFIYVQQIVSRALSGANGIVSSLATMDEDLVNLFDYQEFMELPEYVGGGIKLRDAPKLIKFDSITFHYPQSQVKVLEDVNLEIAKGQHIAIVGENGAGKTTLVKILTGLYKPISGCVYLDDKPLTDYKLSSWHKHLGVLTQDHIRYDFATAKDNIYFGNVTAPFSQEMFDQALKWSESRSFIEKLPKGVDSFLTPWMEDNDGNKGVDLSGGQWQRLALARNFYRNSEIIILDEPTSAIDALAEARIFKHLFEAKGRTIITISHRLNTVKRADKIFMLEEGKLVEQGTHQELVDKKGAYFRLFESQL